MNLQRKVCLPLVALCVLLLMSLDVQDLTAKSYWPAIGCSSREEEGERERDCKGKDCPGEIELIQGSASSNGLGPRWPPGGCNPEISNHPALPRLESSLNINCKNGKERILQLLRHLLPWKRIQQLVARIKINLPPPPPKRRKNSSLKILRITSAMIPTKLFIMYKTVLWCLHLTNTLDRLWQGTTAVGQNHVCDEEKLHQPEAFLFPDSLKSFLMWTRKVNKTLCFSRFHILVSNFILHNVQDWCAQAN